MQVVCTPLLVHFGAGFQCISVWQKISLLRLRQAGLPNVRRIPDKPPKSGEVGMPLNWFNENVSILAWDPPSANNGGTASFELLSPALELTIRAELVSRSSRHW